MAQRQHGGAAIQHIPLTTPGFLGLNKEQAQSILGPEWGTKLDNGILDSSNRVAARSGWLNRTTSEKKKANMTVIGLADTDRTINANVTSHGLQVGDMIIAAGWTPSEYDGDWIVSGVPGVDNFEFVVDTAPGPDTVGGTIAELENFYKGIEYLQEDGTSELFISSDDTFFTSTDSGITITAPTDNSTAFTGRPAFGFTNFNDLVYIAQVGTFDPRVYDGSTVEDVVGTEVPVDSNGVILGVFGRLWLVDSDGVTIRYSSLLDPTDWSTGAGGGVVDTTSIWKDNDSIVALAEHNGTLVVLGKNNIIIFDDNQGSSIGLDPQNIYAMDVLSGVGLFARDSVQNVAGDLWFLSYQGVQSLGRLIQERSQPMVNVSQNVQTYLDSFVGSSTGADIASVYSPENRFYLLSLPSLNSLGSQDGRVFSFDTRRPLEDGSYRCTGEWTQYVPKFIMRELSTGSLYTDLHHYQGRLGRYTGKVDHTSTYGFSYESGWSPLSNPDGLPADGILKIMKSVKGVFALTGTQSITFKTMFDFDDANAVSRSVSVVGGIVYSWGGGFSYGGAAAYSGGIDLGAKGTPVAGTGEYIKVGVDTTIDGNEFAIQQVTYSAKLGRQVI